MSPKRHWLMKTEPEAFGIDDLRRVKHEPWTGVRNYQARNTMRDDMQVGDDVLFYHSNAKPTGVAGLARISKNGVIDETQFEPSSKYYDPKSKRDAPTWICVEVEYASTFAEVLTLDAMREVPGIEDMVLLRKGSRLSVQPVTAEEFKRVVAAAKKLGPVKR